MWYEAAQQPVLTADALVVYDVDAKRVVYEQNADVPLPPASLTKLMTALLTLEDNRLNDEVEILASDLIGGATMGLAAGETISVHDLLSGLLVPSGNDAAMALARHVGGDVDAFVEKMNARASQLGLDNSHYVNPNGYDADGHYTSAADLLALTLELLKYPLFDEIVQTDEATVAGHLLQNTNEFLGYYPGVTGIKTGTTTLAGQCLVTRIEQDGRSLLIVVLGSEDRYADVATLHELYLANYRWIHAGLNDLSVMNRLYVDSGVMEPIGASEDSYTALQHRWSEPEVKVYRDIRLPERDIHSEDDMQVEAENPLVLQRADSVGSAIWTLGDDVLMESELRVR